VPKMDIIDNSVAVLVVRCTHTGYYADGRKNPASVTIYDLDEHTPTVVRNRSVPIPPKKTVDIPMSTRTFVSWYKGDISKLVTHGLLRAEIVLQVRDKSSLGGADGTGQHLKQGLPNLEVLGGRLRMVIPGITLPGGNTSADLGSIGFLAGEEIRLEGVSSRLDGDYYISSVSSDTNLSGTNTGSYLIEATIDSEDVAPSTLGLGVKILLPQGRVTSQFNGGGNVGGLGSNVFGYIGGMELPTSASGESGGDLWKRASIADPSDTVVNSVSPVPIPGTSIIVPSDIPAGSALVITGNWQWQTNRSNTALIASLVLNGSSTVGEVQVTTRRNRYTQFQFDFQTTGGGGDVFQFFGNSQNSNVDIRQKIVELNTWVSS